MCNGNKTASGIIALTVSPSMRPMLISNRAQLCFEDSHWMEIAPQPRVLIPSIILSILPTTLSYALWLLIVAAFVSRNPPIFPLHFANALAQLSFLPSNYIPTLPVVRRSICTAARRLAGSVCWALVIQLRLRLSKGERRRVPWPNPSPLLLRDDGALLSRASWWVDICWWPESIQPEITLWRKRTKKERGRRKKEDFILQHGWVCHTQHSDRRIQEQVQRVYSPTCRIKEWYGIMFNLDNTRTPTYHSKKIMPPLKHSRPSCRPPRSWLAVQSVLNRRCVSGWLLSGQSEDNPEYPFGKSAYAPRGGIRINLLIDPNIAPHRISSGLNSSG